MRRPALLLERSGSARLAAEHGGIACSVPARHRDARHRPEATLLYQLVERHYPAFRALRCESGRPLPEHVEQEFGAYMECGRLEHGFRRVRCEV